jgi:hypothetical protein
MFISGRIVGHITKRYTNSAVGEKRMTHVLIENKGILYGHVSADLLVLVLRSTVTDTTTEYCIFLMSPQVILKSFHHIVW